ncbi:flagellar hook-length control protein FliK [Kaarinaea lacus]
MSNSEVVAMTNVSSSSEVRLSQSFPATVSNSNKNQQFANVLSDSVKSQNKASASKARHGDANGKPNQALQSRQRSDVQSQREATERTAVTAAENENGNSLPMSPQTTTADNQSSEVGETHRSSEISQPGDYELQHAALGFSTADTQVDTNFLGGPEGLATTFAFVPETGVASLQLPSQGALDNQNPNSTSLESGGSVIADENGEAPSLIGASIENLLPSTSGTLSNGIVKAYVNNTNYANAVTNNSDAVVASNADPRTAIHSVMTTPLVHGIAALPPSDAVLQEIKADFNLDNGLASRGMAAAQTQLDDSTQQNLRNANPQMLARVLRHMNVSDSSVESSLRSQEALNSADATSADKLFSSQLLSSQWQETNQNLNGPGFKMAKLEFTTTLQQYHAIEDAGNKEISGVMMRESLNPTRMSANPMQTANPAFQLSAALNSTAWSNEMGQRMLWFVQQDIQQAQLQINPKHLGPLDIKISVGQDQQVNVSFLTQTGSVKEALDAALPRLREMFEQQGLNLGNVDISQQSQKQQNSQQDAPNRVFVDNEQLAEKMHEDDEIPIASTTVLDGSAVVDYYA